MSIVTRHSDRRPCLPSDENADGTPATTNPSRLWLWFVAAFLIQAAAWSAWIMIASHNKVQEVPLDTALSSKL
jgi:hypothetical protein